MGCALKGSFDTRTVKKSDRIDLWEERCSANVIGLTCTTMEEDGFQAKFDQYDFGSFGVFDITGAAHVISRPAELVRTREKDSVFLAILMKGTAFVNRGKICTTFNQGDLVLYDTNSPYMHGFPEDMHHVIFDLPGEEFRARFSNWDLREAVRIDGNLGAGVGIADGVRKTYSAVRARKYLAPEPDLVGNIWAALEQTRDLLLGSANISSYQLGILQRVRHYIRAQLDDPHLDTGRVAREIGMSSRQLNRILAQYDLTVRKLILAERLERARQILEKAGLGKTNLSELAYNCGFSGPSQFSKSFRRQFGVAPSEVLGSTRAAH